MLGVLKKIFPSKNDREISAMDPAVKKIAGFEPAMEALSDEELAGRTDEFRKRLSEGETLEGILPEAFAAVREAGKRVMNMRHYDVQMMGGMVLNSGKIAEMRTGEGKTLVATLPVYLNALEGKGAHVITVNDYLAERDSLGTGVFKGMGEVYRFLGLTVGCIKHDMHPEEKREAYLCDVTYGTNNEFGFDYLRDNMVQYKEHQVQRDLNFALVDEVDSILVDEARTPLIISGPAEASTDKYAKADKLVRTLKKEEHYTLDEKARSAALNDEGIAAAERYLEIDNLYDDVNTIWVHHVQQALKAHTLFTRDKDYMVRDDKVVIVDEFTGRAMEGRRFGDGLHQALEAKERVTVERENQTLATITLQNYFRMYKKLSGMTGTAMTEAGEFHEIYKLAVIEIPTHRPMVRDDKADVIYKNVAGKFKAVADDIKECHHKGQPVLVGTVSIEKNELLSSLLTRRGIPHELLNAKNHAREADIISAAGQKGAVTIATNMAGRGTDIVLGEGVADLGGLHVIGTERHESRRIDLQLRGRSGRQGDAGSSRFYVSLEDDLMRIFGSEKIAGIMEKLGMTEDEAIEHSMISKSIERAQKSVEGHNFDIRKHLLEYDDVMNKQREVVYTRRQALVEGEDVHKDVKDMMLDLVEARFEAQAPEGVYPEEWDLDVFYTWFNEQFNETVRPLEGEALKTLHKEEYIREMMRLAEKAYEKKEKELGQEAMRRLERHVVLDVMDTLWKEHLYAMDQLREGIGLRAYGQKDPLLEYKREGFEMFAMLMGMIKEEVIPVLMRVQRVSEERVPMLEADLDLAQLQESREIQLPGMPDQPQQGPQAGSPELGTESAPKNVPLQPIKRQYPKVGRNEPCPCGSGKKYKKCHGT